MAEKTIKVKVQRFNASSEKEPRFQTYQVPLTSGTSVMNILDFIFRNLDSTLAYYTHTTCYRGKCGRCTLIVNGKASLACQTSVTSDITVETPKRFQVVRDLVYFKP